MKNLHLLFSLLFIVLGLSFSGCETREDTKQPVACFSFEPTTDIEPGTDINFTNCSTDAETYTWEFDDGEGSVAQNPVHSFDQAGEYDVKLIVTNKNLRNEISHTVVVQSLDPVACFSISPNPATINQNVTFTNCSENATSYAWDFNSDGTVDSELENPVMQFLNNGTYNVKLTAFNGSKSNSQTVQLIVGVPDYDPTVYDLPVGWNEYYFNDFDVQGDWAEETTSDYAKVIEEGHYKLTNFLEESIYLFWTNAIGMPSTSSNYDLEARFYIEYDNVTQGDGLFWALDNSTTPMGYYYLRHTFFEGLGYYFLGDSKNGTWVGSTEQPFSTSTAFFVDDYNKLTIRKYFDKYYFFINQVFVGSHNYPGDYGPKFGFMVGAGSKVWVDAVGIWEMDFGGAKAATLKTETMKGLHKIPFGIDGSKDNAVKINK